MSQQQGFGLIFAMLMGVNFRLQTRSFGWVGSVAIIVLLKSRANGLFLLRALQTPCHAIRVTNEDQRGNGWRATLTDVFGKVVFKDSYTSNTISMNPKIPHGLYFLKVTSMDSKQTFTRKVVRE